MIIIITICFWICLAHSFRVARNRSLHRSEGARAQTLFSSALLVRFHWLTCALARSLACSSLLRFVHFAPLAHCARVAASAQWRSTEASAQRPRIVSLAWIARVSTRSRSIERERDSGRESSPSWARALELSSPQASSAPSSLACAQRTGSLRKFSSKSRAAPVNSARTTQLASDCDYGQCHVCVSISIARTLFSCLSLWTARKGWKINSFTHSL